MGLDKYSGRSAGEKRIILKIKPEKVFYMKQGAAFTAAKPSQLCWTSYWRSCRKNSSENQAPCIS
jgi:hypothetical protein